MGDSFINEFFHVLPEIRNKATVSKKEKPYMYRFYNVTCFAANSLSQVRSVLTRIYNAVVKALNDFNKMPRFIVMIPNKDIFNGILEYKLDADIQKPAKMALEWITNNMSKAITAKTEFLMEGKPSSITAYEPKVIWVKAIHLAVEVEEQSLIETFNSTLEEILAGKANHYIIDVNEALNDVSYFSGSALNGFGSVKFWKEIDRQICAFDKRKMSLGPIARSLAVNDSDSEVSIDSMRRNRRFDRPHTFKYNKSKKSKLFFKKNKTDKTRDSSSRKHKRFY